VEADPTSHSVTHSFVTDAAGIDEKDDRLTSPPQDLSSTSRLIFWHRFVTEEGFDGGVLEISTDGGNTWADVGAGSFIEGGYNATISSDDNSRIAGRDAWTGNSASVAIQTRVEVNLGSFAGSDRLIRWRFVGDPFVEGSIPGASWAVDDVLFSNLKVNCPPFARDDFAATVNGIPIAINVLANDSEPNEDPMTVTAVTQPAHGTAAINPNQTVTYDPVCVFQGTDTFTYTVSDGQGGTDTATVSVRARKTSRRGSFPC
jgi:Bacterial Ig domain